jgi:tyrosyl-tRNA synthetase
MGKSLGNYIGVAESPSEQFGKTMRIPDELMREWFTLLTDRRPEQIAEILAGKPNEAKKRLAADIVTGFHGEAVADAVLADWRKQFEQKGDPEQIPEVVLQRSDLAEFSAAAIPAPRLLVLAGLAKSNSEARNKITEGAFNYGPDREKITDWKASLPVSDGLILRLGRKIVRIRLESSGS